MRSRIYCLASALVFLARAAPPAFAQSSGYVEIEKVKKHAPNALAELGCATEAAHWKDLTRKRMWKGRIQDYVRVEAAIDWKCFVRVGGELKAVTVEGMVAAGKSSSIELIMPEKDYRRLDEYRYWRHPFDPRRLPVGGSLIIEKSRFGETSLSAAWRFLTADLDYRNSTGMAMGFTRTAKDKVQVYAGPYRGVTSFIMAGVGFDFDFVSLFAGGYSRREQEHYRTRTAVFDIGTRSGLAAYNEFFLTGRMAEVRNRPGVSRVGRLYSNSDYHEDGAALGVSLKTGIVNITVGGAHAGDSLRAESNMTKYDKGGEILSRTQIYGNNGQNVQISFKETVLPGRPKLEYYQVLLDDVDRETAVRFSNFARGSTWIPGGGRPNSLPHHFALVLTFEPGDLQRLKRRAAKCLADTACKERFRDYYGDLPKFLREHPYPNMTFGIVPSKVKIMRQFSDPGHTDFDHYAPARILVPFMPIEPWLIESCFRTMAPHAAGGKGEPFYRHLLLVGLK